LNGNRNPVPDKLSDLKILIRGAGEMATGTAVRLHNSGFPSLLMTEIDRPLAVRRMVSFCEAVHEGSWVVEGVKAVAIGTPGHTAEAWSRGLIPVLVDSQNTSREMLKPDVLIDAILAKKNLGTEIADAPLVIGLGPGFRAGKDVHYVIETNRGHDLGRLISEGEAFPDTGTPGEIAGHTGLRVIRSPGNGVFESDARIGTVVEAGRVVGSVAGREVVAGLAGVLRGLIRPGTRVGTGLKIGDVDPRGKIDFCFTISEKARAIGGAVLEAILTTFNKPNR
jgi:xanthine dehydrogenase accessory factor